MNFRHGHSLKILTFASLCATLVYSCSQNISEDIRPQENIVETAETEVISTSKVVDFQILKRQDFAKPELNERTQLLASVDRIVETSAGHWQFYSNFKLLFTLISPDRMNMQPINGQEQLFKSISFSTDQQSKLMDAVRFNMDELEAIIYVNTLNGTPRLDQNQDQSQDKDQDKDQDPTQDTKGKGNGDDGSDDTPTEPTPIPTEPTPPTTPPVTPPASPAVSVRF